VDEGADHHTRIYLRLRTLQPFRSLAPAIQQSGFENACQTYQHVHGAAFSNEHLHSSFWKKFLSCHSAEICMYQPLFASHALMLLLSQQHVPDVMPQVFSWQHMAKSIAHLDECILSG
jgi:hypothetical protein